MKLIIQSLVSGVFITIVVFLIVFIVDVGFGPGSDSGIELLKRTPFAWVFLWSKIFFNNPLGSNDELLTAIFTNIALYSILSFIFFWQFSKRRKAFKPNLP